MNTLPATGYRIAPLDPHAHLFEVRCTIDDPARDGQCFRLPSWIPGSSLVREFARHFVTVRAESGGVMIAIEKEAQDLWRAARPGSDGIVGAIGYSLTAGLSV